MNIRFFAYLVAWTLSTSLLGPAMAQAAPYEPWGISVEAADPHCDPARSTSFYAEMEFQVGLAAWKHLGRWKMCVNDGGTSEIIVKFQGEPYRATITINGSRAQLAPPAGNGWAFVFTRQDTVSGKPSALPRTTSFLLGHGHSHTFTLAGKYALQERNLRLKISL